jgi:hypothetical protein
VLREIDFQPRQLYNVDMDYTYTMHFRSHLAAMGISYRLLTNNIANINGSGAIIFGQSSPNGLVRRTVYYDAI